MRLLRRVASPGFRNSCDGGRICTVEAVTTGSGGRCEEVLEKEVGWALPDAGVSGAGK